jgi:hypothetical protein
VVDDAKFGAQSWRCGQNVTRVDRSRRFRFGLSRPCKGGM